MPYEKAKGYAPVRGEEGSDLGEEAPVIQRISIVRFFFIEGKFDTHDSIINPERLLYCYIFETLSLGEEPWSKFIVLL